MHLRKPSSATAIAMLALFVALGSASALATSKQGAKAIIARLQSSRAVEVPTSGADASIPFAVASWTQRGEELNGLGGSATITAPAVACSSELVLLVESAGREVAAAFALDATSGSEAILPGETRTVPLRTFLGPWPFAEPGTASTDTLTARVTGACAEGHWTVDSLNVSVVGVR